MDISWNINCCPADHFKSTGEIGGIKILKLNHRPQKNELEFAFEVLPKGQEVKATQAASSKSTKKAAPAKPTHTIPVIPDSASGLSSYIIDLVLEASEGGKNAEQVKQNIGPRIESILSSFKNNAYANGYAAHKKQ